MRESRNMGARSAGSGVERIVVAGDGGGCRRWLPASPPGAV